VPPASGRKGTLDGIQPNQRAAGYGFHEPTEDEFDAEKTMVVDPDDDDAPTQDYDPRTMHHPYDPRARGVYSSSGQDDRQAGSRPQATRSASERAVALGSSAEGGAAVPRIPAAPAAPSFEATPSGVPSPRTSDSGRRRSSRRTVKIPGDQVQRRAPEVVPQHIEQVADPKAGDDADDIAAVEQEPATEQVPATRTDVAPARDITPGADTPADGNESPAAMQDMDSVVDEITIVRPLRIISIGSDPPPPIRSALATWPPSALLGQAADLGLSGRLPGSTLGVSAQGIAELEAGWTPAPPEVSAALAAEDAALEAEALVEEEEAPSIEVRSTTAEAERISEIPLSERDEVLEDIEPDAAPFTTPVTAQPKRPPPPPPKTKPTDAKPTGDTRSAQQTAEPRKGKPWWDDLFSEEYIRTHDQLDEKIVRREVDFIEESLGMEKHAVVLDLACGMGEHAIELCGRGYSVVGFDNSPGMLSHAEQKLKQRLKQSPNAQAPSFVQGDMRELNYEQAFDGVYCWHTSFGYFDEEKNLAVLQQIHRALRQGGMFLLEVINRDYVSPRSPSLVWFEGQQCVCMDDMYVDFFTSRLRVKRTAMFEGGLSRELDYSIRLYTLHELGKLLHDVGFKVVEVTGHPAHPGVFFGTESPRLIVLAERS